MNTFEDCASLDGIAVFGCSHTRVACSALPPPFTKEMRTAMSAKTFENCSGIPAPGSQAVLRGAIPARFTVILGFLSFLFLTTAASHGQFVTITGNSIAHFQAPFAPEEFPHLLASQVNIWGVDSVACAYFLSTNGNGTPLLYFYVPAQTTVAVLIDSTNDIRTGVPVAQHMLCIETTIGLLLRRNPNIKIVVANTPPWTQFNPCTNANNPPAVLTAMQAYNAAYADPTTGLQALYPNNVRVADVYTPAAESNGWANPSYMSGPCGTHPGPEFIWTLSWAHFVPPYTTLVMEAINHQW